MNKVLNSNILFKSDRPLHSTFRQLLFVLDNQVCIPVSLLLGLNSTSFEFIMNYCRIVKFN